MYSKIDEDGKVVKKPISWNPNYILIAIMVGMALSSGAFYYSLSEWQKDQFDRNRIHVQEREYRETRSNTLIAKRTVDIHEIQQSMVDMMDGQVRDFVFNDTSVVAEPTIALWKAYNATIHAVNNSCVTKVKELETIVMQIVAATNSTPVNVFTGFCTFTGLNPVNFTQITAFKHNVIDIGGVEFYYYVFGATNDTVPVGTLGARIGDCLPPIFIGGPTRGTVFRSQITGFTGSPMLPVDYISTIVVGGQELKIVPVAAANPLQELGIGSSGVTVFVSFF